MSAKRKKREPWPEDNAGFMLPLGEGRFMDVGKDVGVWLDYADGFRWAADILVRYAESDETDRDARHRYETGGVSSYRESAKRAVDGAIDQLACASYAPGPVNWLGLTCAVGTLYRHYIELLLKLIVLLCQRLQGKESSFPMTHDLKKLWAEAQEARLGLWPDRDGGEQEALRLAAEHIAWLWERDPSSQVFRYPAPEGISRDRALPHMQELCKHVVPLGNHLRAVALGMWDVRHQQREAQEDMSGSVPDTSP